MKDLLNYVAEAESPEEYTTRLEDLKNHWLWEKYPKLQAYFEKQWEPKHEVECVKKTEFNVLYSFENVFVNYYLK